VTERERPVARLVPPPEADDGARERLIAAGHLVPAVAVFRLPERVDPRPGEPDSAQLLDELRADGL